MQTSLASLCSNSTMIMEETIAIKTEVPDSSHPAQIEIQNELIPGSDISAGTVKLEHGHDEAHQWKAMEEATAVKTEAPDSPQPEIQIEPTRWVVSDGTVKLEQGAHHQEKDFSGTAEQGLVMKAEDTDCDEISSQEHTIVDPSTSSLVNIEPPESGNFGHQMNNGKRTTDNNIIKRALDTKGQIEMQNIIHKGKRCVKSFNSYNREDPYVCDTCGKSFTRNDSLVVHKRQHTGETPYTCDTCGKSLTSNSKLVIHKRHHTGETPYTCDTCGKSFTTHSSLVVHRRRQHTGERPYVCDTCGKSFMRNDSLVVHTRQHTGERPYTCDTCGKSFTVNSKLVIHKRQHTGEQYYTCDTCGKSFTTNSNLVVHKRQHNGERTYACDTCGKSFTRNNSLVVHKRQHTGEQPKLCV